MIPLREPAGVDLRARLRPDVTADRTSRTLLEEHVAHADADRAARRLEEIDADEIVVRIRRRRSTVRRPSLADEILASISELAHGGLHEDAARREGRGQVARQRPGREARRGAEPWRAGHLLLRRCPSEIRSATSWEPRRRWNAADGPGASAAMAGASFIETGATVISARSPSIARTTPAATASGVEVPT